MNLEVGRHTVISKPAIRYLGIIIDGKLSFGEHLSLTKISPNVCEQKYYRLLLTGAFCSTYYLSEKEAGEIGLLADGFEDSRRF